MTNIETSNIQPFNANADVLVVAASNVSGSAHILAAGLDQLHGKQNFDTTQLEEILHSLDFTGKQDAVIRIPTSACDRPVSAKSILVVGTGSTTDPSALRRAAGRASRALAGVQKVAFALPAASVEEFNAVAEGALLGAYSWSHKSPKDTAPVETVSVLSPLAASGRSRIFRRNMDGDSIGVLEHARALSDAVNLTRDLVNDPPNLLTPEAFVQRAKAVVADLKISVDVRDEKQLAREGFGGIAGVGQGSVHPPRLVRLEWAPRKASRHVALIGKGITFDSGGLSLKPSSSMPEMKSDMAGAASVLATIVAAAQLNLNVKVTAWLALAENLPGATAQRPSDIVTMYNDKTVEITNTDAEGRLVMADALAIAATEQPDSILDIATLTGAQIVALGDRIAGVMGDDRVRNNVVLAGDAAGEEFWPMPLPEHLLANLQTPFADIRNAAVGNRAGGMLVAGLFLREFIADIPWAHLDVAGPAYNDSAAWGLTPQGGTGFGVATMLAYVEAEADTDR